MAIEHVPNYSLVYPRIYMGGAVVDADGIFEAFDVVVLSASEWQPEVIPPDRTKDVLRINMHDVDSHLALGPEVRSKLGSLVSTLEKLYREEKRILITCMAGMNRSGLVTALLMMRALGHTPKTAISLIRDARGPSALSNPTFVRYIESLR